jgi:hypothetical protein
MSVAFAVGVPRALLAGALALACAAAPGALAAQAAPERAYIGVAKLVRGAHFEVQGTAVKAGHR